MILWLKEGFLSLKKSSKILLFFLLLLSGINLFFFFEAWNMGYSDRAWTHLIYAISLFFYNLVMLNSSIHLNRATKFYKEAEALYNKDYEEKRMTMYEALLETKEKEIQ